MSVSENQRKDQIHIQGFCIALNFECSTFATGMG